MCLAVKHMLLFGYVYDVDLELENIPTRSLITLLRSSMTTSSGE